MSTELHEYLPNQCEHIRDTGIRCGSPAMRGRDFCYYHRRAHTNILPGDSTYELPILESEQAIQLAVTHVSRAVLKGKLDRRDAATLLQAIRIAHATLKTAKTASLDENARYMEYDLTPAMEKLEAAEELASPDESHSNADGSCSPSSDPAEASNQLNETKKTASSQVIMTANEGSRKDLCIAAAATSEVPRATNHKMPSSPECKVKRFSGTSHDRRRARRKLARAQAREAVAV